MPGANAGGPRLHEKGGKRHEMPAHHNLEAYLDAYIDAAGIRDAGKDLLFPSTARRTGNLTANRMHRSDAWAMIQRRATALGMKARVGRHTFRATGITAYLNGGGTLRTRRPWPLMRTRAPPSSTTALATRSRSMSWSGCRFEKRGRRASDDRLRHPAKGRVPAPPGKAA